MLLGITAHVKNDMAVHVAAVGCAAGWDDTQASPIRW